MIELKTTPTRLESTWMTEISPATVLPVGTILCFPGVWGWKDVGGGQTDSFDVEVCNSTVTDLWAGIYTLEQKLKHELAQRGCSYMRAYYIEGLQEWNGKIIVNLGT